MTLIGGGGVVSQQGGLYPSLGGCKNIPDAE